MIATRLGKAVAQTARRGNSGRGNYLVVFAAAQMHPFVSVGYDYRGMATEGGR